MDKKDKYKFMSKVIFIASEKQLNLKQLGIMQIIPNEYFKQHYPYLKDKKYIYDFEGFNRSISYKELIHYLLEKIDEENAIAFIIMKQTDNIDEITSYNSKIKHKNVIDISNDNEKIYDLIYRLETNSLLSSTAYVLTQD